MAYSDTRKQRAKEIDEFNQSIESGSWLDEYDWLPDSYEGTLKVDYQRSKPNRDNLTSEPFFHQCTSADVRFWFPWKDEEDKNDYTQSAQHGRWPDPDTWFYKH